MSTLHRHLIAPATALLTLGERLTREAAARPARAPDVEAVTAALGRSGLSLGPVMQVLARTVGARYCASTATAAGLGVAVCEYGDDAEAERGLVYSRRAFDRLIPGRTLLRNRATVITLTGDDGRGAGPALAAERAAAARIFAAL